MTYHASFEISTLTYHASLTLNLLVLNLLASYDDMRRSNIIDYLSQRFCGYDLSYKALPVLCEKDLSC